MKRQKRKNSPAKKQGPAAPPAPAKRKRRMSRREMLSLAKFGAGALVVVGGGGWYLASSVSASIHEQDLSRLGNGVPAIVQIHDPDCPSCVILQRASRKAMENFSEDELQFLVVNITQPQGRRFAETHGVGNTTLVFFDGRGRRRTTLVGTHPEDVLEEAFQKAIDFNARGRS